MEGEQSTPASSASSSTGTSTSTTNSTGTTSASTASTVSSSSSSTSSGRAAVPQISVYSGIHDRQTVQVQVTLTLKHYHHFKYRQLSSEMHSNCVDNICVHVCDSPHLSCQTFLYNHCIAPHITFFLLKCLLIGLLIHTAIYWCVYYCSQKGKDDVHASYSYFFIFLCCGVFIIDSRVDL